MLKKNQVCACKFVRPQKVILSAEGTVLSPRWLRTVSKSCFHSRQTWWELEDGRRKHLLAYEVNKRHVSCRGFGANTQSGSPGLFGSAKVTIRVSPPCHFVRGRLVLDNVLKPFTFCAASRAFVGWKPKILVGFPRRKSRVQNAGTVYASR